MATTTPVRAAYLPPHAPRAYNPDWLGQQLGLIARAVPPSATRSVTAATTVLPSDTTIFCDATGGAFAVTLLPASQVQYQTVTIKKTDSSANAVTITGTVDGAVNPTLATQYKAKTIQSDGTNWYTLATV